jgi:hypothetical protein
MSPRQKAVVLGTMQMSPSISRILQNIGMGMGMGMGIGRGSMGRGSRGFLVGVGGCELGVGMGCREFVEFVECRGCRECVECVECVEWRE